MGAAGDAHRSCASGNAEVTLPHGTDVLCMIDAIPGDVPFAYFENRDGSSQLGIGVVEVVRFEAASLEAILERVSSGGSWIGGIRFDPENTPAPTTHDPWHAFGAAWFLRPAILIASDGGTTRMFVEPGNGALANRVLRALRESEQGYSREPGCDASWSTLGGEPAWQHAFDRAMDTIRRGELDKVVLARAWSSRVAPTTRFGSLLRSSARRTSSCFRYVLRPEPGSCFAGTTPELLARSTSNVFASEAVAGTMRSEHAAHLIEDDKNCREHAFVADSIDRVLHECGASRVLRGDPFVRAHGSLSHIVTSFEARGVASPQACIARLHPTPAVCGHPRRPALEFIREHEGIDRGFYSGLVGTIDGNVIELAVALRCALLDREEAIVYAGGGIVAGSDRASEALELEDKSAQWRNLLCSGARVESRLE
ncbi:MAG: isochorismate synthase [Planctomycetes bacterium]|nr:isochorismate synthase [Planctomycetota bacterium]MCB9917831.1 isochorismate synthase [Planctomycetota bacterium]